MTIDASVRSRWIQALAIAGVILFAALLLAPAIEQSREAARRSQSKNNLKQLGLALHNYHDSLLSLPPGGIFASDGRGMHGWGIFLLPFAEASPLYFLVDFKQPWDAPYYAGCYAYRHPLFINPSIVESSARDRRAGQFAPCHYSANSNLLAANSMVKLSNIEDQGQTFVMGELGGDFVPWGCPYNWRPLVSLTDTPRTYGRIENYGGQFLMADGSVRWIAPDVSAELLAKLRGANLTGEEAQKLKVPRPSSFPYPADARDPWADLRGDKR